MDILRQQSAETSNYIIKNFNSNSKFISLAKIQTERILTRDREDGVELEKGVSLGISRGNLKPLDSSPEYLQINVLGKSPREVCEIIVEDLNKRKEEGKGSVIVLVGLSGTGKGTTVANLSQILPSTLTWSNGNIFRCFTHLATVFCSKNNLEVTKENLEPQIPAFVDSLTFDSEKHDIHVKAEELDVDFFVEDVKNTTLKAPGIGKNIPLVASLTQGEAVNFAKSAIEILKENGKNVLLEGRSQTVDFIESEFRYELTLSDTEIIGQRRLAQLIAASTLASIDSLEDSSTLTSETEILSLIEEQIHNFTM